LVHLAFSTLRSSTIGCTGCGGLCQLTKRDFYGLFRAAYKRAFTEKNIESAWRRTGLQPLDPEVVLSQISKTTTERPATSHSISSTSTVYSASRIREVRRLVKRVVGEGELSRDAVKLGDFVEKIAAQNSVLTARIQGLQTAVVIEKKKRRRGKPVIPNIRTITGGKATIWSPVRLATSIQIIRDAEDAKDQEIKDKAKAKELKRAAKMNQDKLSLQRRQDKEKMKKGKQKEIELTFEQRLQGLQLTDEVKLAPITPKNTRKGSPSKKKVTYVINSDEDEDYKEEVVITPLIRTPRKRGAPKWFGDFSVS
jgi:hypothetical protein